MIVAAEHYPAVPRSPLGAGLGWHGIGWSFVRCSDGRTAPRLDALCQPTTSLDGEGIREAWGLAPIRFERTVIADIRRRPPTSRPEGEPPAEPIEEAFERAVASLVATSPDPVIALGGGLDATAVLVAWHEVSGRWPAVATLRTGCRTYDEVDVARSIGGALGVAVDTIDVPLADLGSWLEAAVAAAETPLYGFHPVGRLAFARALHQRGAQTLITGDGADPLLRRQPDYDYVPIVHAVTEAQGLTLRSPFFDDTLVARALASAGAGRAEYADKRWLRKYVAARGAPSWLSERPKQPRVVPPGAVALDVPDSTIVRIRDRLAPLGLTALLDPSSPADRLRVASLALLLGHLGV